jgi:branched-subunit amino acid transport protein
MTEVWITIAALAIGTAAIKAAGPLFLGGRELPPRATAFISLLPAALLAALVVVETFGEESGGITFDARAAGLAAAGIALLLRGSIVVVVIAAAVAAAAVRAFA